MRRSMQRLWVEGFWMVAKWIRSFEGSLKVVLWRVYPRLEFDYENYSRWGYARMFDLLVAKVVVGTSRLEGFATQTCFFLKNVALETVVLPVSDSPSDQNQQSFASTNSPSEHDPIYCWSYNTEEDFRMEYTTISH
ncbi:hypothetical protein ACH5RR_029370 [Cinchona calisaya]|uniref:Uncharacterized protein n=1 Tax=Cinchona calisaya TaxID=153742 RepID=A0ABD2YRF8_9GENT